MAFPPQFLDEIRARVPLSGVAGRRVRLQRRGREFSGLCPFHNEKSPSFTINEDKGFFHCFGCGAHGDVITFEMRAAGLSFVDAVERLAGEAGLEVPKSSPEERDRARRHATLHEVIEAAAVFFEKQLRMPAGRAALEYLHGRGVDEETIARFRLGYAPGGNALKAALRRESVDEELMAAGGLIGVPDDGRPAYDVFRDRVMFPITDRRGRIIAFGGRVMGDGHPKYLNSPDTDLFQKGHVLYGLAQARTAAQEKGAIIVAEGYMDVIALSRGGFRHAVAPLGTALTETQIEELWRQAPEPVLCFDGDAAGRRAAQRAAERALPLLRPGLSLSFAMLPQGKDPDDLLRAEGAPAMAAVLGSAIPLSEAVWRALSDGRKAETPEQRAALDKDIDTTVERIADPAIRQHYRTVLRRRAWQFFLPPRRDGAARHGGAQVHAFPAAATPEPRVGDGVMRDVLALLLGRPQLLVSHFEEAMEILAGADALARLAQEAVSELSVNPDIESRPLVGLLHDRGHGATLELLKGRIEALWRRLEATVGAGEEEEEQPDQDLMTVAAIEQEMAALRDLPAMRLDDIRRYADLRRRRDALRDDQRPDPDVEWHQISLGFHCIRLFEDLTRTWTALMADVDQDSFNRYRDQLALYVETRTRMFD
ncbi:MAG: DNA primase [Alphaproteobacteria bacterium]